MRTFFLVAALPFLLLVGCNDSNDDGEGIVMASGTITTEDGQQADVMLRKAFGFAVNGSALVYMASNKGATCDNVVEYISNASLFDPADILLSGHCNTIFKFKYEDTWDGLTFSEADIFSALWSVSCGLGEGDFELENKDGEEDYYYSGTWWQGSPESHNTSITNVSDNITLNFDMGPYLGYYIYEGLDDITATGQVGGSVEAQRCPGLAQTDLFSF
jgi:hypothetical protein